MSEKREFTGVFIPAHIWVSKELIPAEKMILGEIDALSKKTGWCDASRAHFADWLSCTPPNITYYLLKLEKLGFIEVRKNPGYRSKMRLVNARFYEADPVSPTDGGSKRGLPVGVNGIDGGSKRGLPEIKEEIQDQIKGKRKDMSAQTADCLPEKPSLDTNPSQEGKATPIPATPSKKVKADPNDCRKVAEPLLESIKQEGLRLLAENAPQEKLDRLREKYRLLEKDIRIDYDIDKAINLLNELMGTEFETETPSYRKLARLRFQKYSYAQMELVIRYKVKEWKDNDKMRGYLRPSTLFNGSFAEYLEAAKLDKQSPLTPKDAPYKLEPAPERKPIAAYTP